MARKQKSTFWTISKLRELDRMFKTNSQRQLESHFSKRYDEIQQAWEFWQNHKRLKISSVKKRKIRITLYRAAHAEGAEHVSSYRSEFSLL